VVETLIGGTCIFLQGPPRVAAPRLTVKGERLSLDRFGVAMGHTVYANLMGLFPPASAHEEYPHNVEMRSRLVGWQVGNIPFYTLSEPPGFTVSPMIALGHSDDQLVTIASPPKVAVAA
jgi:hypothetical protein